jgi:hypothetical protein
MPHLKREQLPRTMAVGAFAALVLIDEPAYGGLVKIPTAQGLSVEEHLA